MNIFRWLLPSIWPSFAIINHLGRRALLLRCPGDLPGSNHGDGFNRSHKHRPFWGCLMALASTHNFLSCYYDAHQEGIRTKCLKRYGLRSGCCEHQSRAAAAAAWSERGDQQASFPGWKNWPLTLQASPTLGHWHDASRYLFTQHTLKMCQDVLKYGGFHEQNQRLMHEHVVLVERLSSISKGLDNWWSLTNDISLAHLAKHETCQHASHLLQTVLVTILAGEECW